MSTFIEAQFPTNISRGALGGPSFSTDIVAVTSGYEKRNINWSRAKAKYEVSHGVRTPVEYSQLLAFFNMVRGRAIGFRFKDWLDYQITTTNGVLGTSVNGSLQSLEEGYSEYTLGKIYKFGSIVSDYYIRSINKPISGTLTVYRNGTPIAVSGSASEIASISYTTGLITFNPKNTFTVNSVTKGATTSIVVTGNQSATISTGNKLKFASCSSNGITALGLTYHTVNSVTYNNPNTTVVLSTNTSAYTGTWTGTTSLYKYEQGNIFTAAAEFDVPCRFDIDSMQASLDSHISSSWTSIPLVEVKI